MVFCPSIAFGPFARNCFDRHREFDGRWPARRGREEVGHPLPWTAFPPSQGDREPAHSHTLRAGESAKGQVTLICATKYEAILRVDSDVYRKKSVELLPSEILLTRDSAGMFDVAGTINGAPVLFLVDTGATLVTLNAAIAKRLKLKYSKKCVITTGSHPSNPLLGNSFLSSVYVGQKVQVYVAERGQGGLAVCRTQGMN